jgi:signal transduction histidine kinase
MTPASWFMLASLVILTSGMAGIGWWIARQIENGVVSRAGYTTALYVDSFIAPPLQELTIRDSISAATMAELERLLRGTTLGQEMVSFRVWSHGGKVVYSDDQSLIGQVFPVSAELQESWEGRVTADISDLTNLENVNERSHATQLLEIYSPVRANGGGKVIGVAEFYMPITDLNKVIFESQQRSWMIIVGTTLGMYLLLSGFVHRSSTTIVRQEAELRERVARLTEVVAQNEELHDRVRRAAARSTAYNERFLRRVSAELHDGPAQHLGLALLRIDQVSQVCEEKVPEAMADLGVVQEALTNAMQEVRSISAGLGLPHIETLSLTDTVSRVVRSHERITGTSVQVKFVSPPQQVCLATKITTYRLVQEALGNAARHAGGVGQQVTLEGDGDWLIVSVSDKGPGFSMPRKSEWGQHMGLAGMRERVESLGGDFAIMSRPSNGTNVTACLPCQTTEEII